MKKFWWIVLLLLFISTNGYSQDWNEGWGGGSGVRTDSDCDQAKYYSIGTLCQDTDDGKLYKGTGAAVSEIAAGSDISGLHYVTNQTESELSNEVNLGALTTGLLKITVATGVATPSTAASGTDYQAPLTAGVDYLAPDGDGSALSGVVTAEADSVVGAVTGIVYSDSGFSAADYGDVVGLWASGSCSGYLKSDGTCDAGGGGAPTDAHYLTDQAESGLSAEVVVSANGKSLVTAADYAAMKGLLDLEIGTDVMAHVAPGTSGNILKSNGSAWTSSDSLTAQFDDSAAQFKNSGDATKQVKIDASNQGAGETGTIQAPKNGSVALVAGTMATTSRVHKLAVFYWDGGGSEVTTGADTKRCTQVANAATITGVFIKANESSTLTITPYKDAFATDALATTALISGAGTTGVTATLGVHDTTLTNWTTSISANDEICAQVTTNDNALWISMVIHGTYANP